MRDHLVSPSCGGEYCGVCWREFKIKVPATHKLGEELLDGPFIMHALTQYVCCKHFAVIVGEQSAITWRGCQL